LTGSEKLKTEPRVSLGFGGTGEQKEVVEGDFANSDFDVCSEHE
jgi:hypothetical protein